MMNYWNLLDLWTTRCTRCPAALDSLNETASNAVNSTSSNPVQFLSICCGDTLDGAREILEATKEPRWNAMRHYFMAFHDKERLKQILQFSQVPFYIVFDQSGILLYSGSKKTDFQELFGNSTGISVYAADKVSIPTSTKLEKLSDDKQITTTDVRSPTSALSVPAPLENNTTLVIDDMDF
jgi:hypothetical protein